MKHFLYVPWTGLGLYNGFRGNGWLKKRMVIFKQFVLPSLLAQTDKDFVVWFSWRPEERHNPVVKKFIQSLEAVPIKIINSYGGVCFWDDKYEASVARLRLATALHESLRDIINETGVGEDILMTIQPSDDCYNRDMVKEIKQIFTAEPEIEAVGYRRGYIMNYFTGEVAEYNPLTIPPFFTIRFKREVFIDPLKHIEYTGPYQSHEYIGKKLKFKPLEKRGFLVGTHSENISTVFNHPFKGRVVERAVLQDFGLETVPNLKIKFSLRKKLLKKLPFKWQRKIRYIFGERGWNKVYEWLRS